MCPPLSTTTTDSTTPTTPTLPPRIAVAMSTSSMLSLTPTASTQPPTPQCSSLAGTGSITAYEEESRSRVIAVQCEFTNPSFGLSSAQVLTRTLYVCSEGEVVVSGPVYRRTYTCPPLSTTTTATTTSTMSTLPLAMSTSSKLDPTTATAGSLTTPASTTADVVNEDPLCSTVSGSSSIHSFTMDSRSRLCRTKCKVPVAGSFRPRFVYSCCSGEAQRLAGRSQLSCPSQ